MTVARSPDDLIETQRGTMTVAELRARCRVLEPGIVCFREIPYGTVAAFEVEMETLKELAKPFGSFVVVVDLEEATRPKPDLIEYILDNVATVGEHWCTVQPGGVFMRSVVRFVVGRMSKIRHRLTIHESIEDALPVAREVLEKVQSA